MRLSVIGHERKDIQALCSLQSRNNVIIWHITWLPTAVNWITSPKHESCQTLQAKLPLTLDRIERIQTSWHQPGARLGSGEAEYFATCVKLIRADVSLTTRVLVIAIIGYIAGDVVYHGLSRVSTVRPGSYVVTVHLYKRAATFSVPSSNRLQHDFIVEDLVTLFSPSWNRCMNSNHAFRTLHLLVLPPHVLPTFLYSKKF